jgi:hypothetical protein
MTDLENFKLIKLRYENIFIFDDKYVISKSDNITQSDLKAKPDYAAILGLIFLGIMFSMFFTFLYAMIKYNLYSGVSIILCLLIFIFRGSILYRLSGKSVLYKKKITRIYINEKMNCIFFKFKESGKRVKIRSLGLPLDINKREEIFQTLYENNLIGKEYISQIFKMKEGYLYIKDKFVSFVDFKLYSKNIDAKRYIKGVYLLMGYFSFAFVISIALFILWYNVDVFKDIYCLIIAIVGITVSIVYFRILHKQLIKSKSFFIRKNQIVDISVDGENNQKAVVKYYNKRKQLKQKKFFLPEDEREKNTFLNLLNNDMRQTKNKL